MARPRLQIGFIGCGRIASSHADVLCHLGHHISSVSARPGSPHLPEFADRYGVPRSYPSPEAQWAEERPDAWWVLTPYQVTDRLLPALAACTAPCFVEKPAAMSSVQAARALQVQTARGTRMQVGYNRRFYSVLDAVRARLSAGNLTAVEVHLAEPVDRLLASGELQAPGDLLCYKGSHVLDLVCHLLGPLEVRTMCASATSDRQPASFNGLLWSPTHRVPVHFSANWSAPVNAGVALYFGDELLRISPLERLVVTRGLRVVDPSRVRPFRTYEPMPVSEAWVEGGFKPGFVRQAEHFIDSCVLGRIPNGIGPTLSESLELAHLCERISVQEP